MASGPRHWISITKLRAPVHCVVVVLVVCPLLAGCGSDTSKSAVTKSAGQVGDALSKPDEAAAATVEKDPEKVAAKHLPNAVQLTDKVISGGQPDGEKAFEELAALGVKTVISVDGATPDVQAARKHGLRYVHLPHGYDGIAEERLRELAKAVRDLPGPIYIHCHHGKHRSPAAAASACVAAGLLDSSKALSVLKIAGTHEGYRGLYAVAQDTKAIDQKLLDELKVEFVEVAKIPPFAEAMVALEHTHDHLKSISAAEWKSPPDHPDLAPEHEALLLREHFTELLRSEPAAKQTAEFREMLQQSEGAAKTLEELLIPANWNAESGAKAKAALDVISKNCSACHQEFRDVPLSEKTRTK